MSETRFYSAVAGTADARRYCQRLQAALRRSGLKLAYGRLPGDIELGAGVHCTSEEFEELCEIVMNRVLSEKELLPIQGTIGPPVFDEAAGMVYLPVTGQIVRVANEVNAELNFLGYFGNEHRPFDARIVLAEGMDARFAPDIRRILDDFDLYTEEVESSHLRCCQYDGSAYKAERTIASA